MSKKVKTSKFTYIPTTDLPKLPKNIPTEWDMVGLYYKSINDQQIEKDVVTTEKLYRRFVKQFKDSDFTSNAKTLRQALDQINIIENTPAVAKPVRYLSL